MDYYIINMFQEASVSLSVVLPDKVFHFSIPDLYLAHVIEQPNFRIPNPQYFVYLLDQTVGRDTLQFIY